MTDHPDDTGTARLDLADRTMLAVIKANLLGVERKELRISRFRVLERLGEGSMGIVFAALDDRLQRRVALKLLHQAVGASEDERHARLLREAQILAQLEHPNIVQVYEAGEHEGQLYMVMELVEGQTLGELQRERGRNWKSLLALYVAAGRGLAAAHEQGVVHRDFKPHNVIVDAKGRVRVVDFGLAREVVADDEHLTAEIPLVHQGAIERPLGEPLTATGVVPGTPAYMAPELFDGQPASALSDQFSFCVALYEAMYGRRPFEGRRVRDVVTAAKEGRILPPPDHAAPRWLFVVLARGLAAEPAARHPSMTALLAELERDRARPWKRAGVALAMGAVLGGGWWMSTYDERRDERRKDACRDDVDELEKHWRLHAPRLARPEWAREDADGLTSLLEADAARFVTLWRRACEDDRDGTAKPRLDEARRVFEQVVSRGVHEVLSEDAVNAQIHELELGLEGREEPSCKGPEPGSPAVTALGDARAADLAGDRDQALQLARGAKDLAEAEHDDLTRLRLALYFGADLERQGDASAAAEVFDEVQFDALLCDADVLAFDAALAGAKAEVLHSGRYGLASWRLGRARKLLEKTDDAELPRMPLRQAELEMRWGTAELYLAQECDAARSHFERALAQLEDLRDKRAADEQPTDHVERLAADAELNLANVDAMALSDPTGHCRPRDASGIDVVTRLGHARARFAEAAGRNDHPGLLAYDYSLGAARAAIRDFAAASEAFTSALTIGQTYYGDESLIVARLHWALATALGETAEPLEARRPAERSLEIRLAHEGASRLDLAESYELVGLILNEQEDHEAAREKLALAVEQLRRSPELPLERHELERFYEITCNLGVVELALVDLERGDVAELRQVREQLRVLGFRIAERTGARPPDTVQRRVIEATLELVDGARESAIALLDGIESRPEFPPQLQPYVDRVRREAAGPT
jgi:serine/threonine protein kinase